MPKFWPVLAVYALLSVFMPVRAEILAVSDRILFIPDDEGAGTRFQMIVAAGCHDEPDGACRGIAHYLEHLVMLGRNPGHNDAAVRLFGDGGANGWTVERATVFFHMLPNRPTGPRADLQRLFGFYAGRLTDFAITPADAARERSVVVQEHDWRMQANAFVEMERRLSRAAVPDRPSGQWTIGERDTLQTMTVDAARAFHRRWYHRSNAWFIVSAPRAAEDEVRSIAGSTLAGLPRDAVPPREEHPLSALEPVRIDLREHHGGIRRAGVIIKKAVVVPGGDPVEMRALRRLLTDFLASRLPGSLAEQLGDRDGLISTRPSIAIEEVGEGGYVLHIGVDCAAEVEAVHLRDAVVRYIDSLAGGETLTDDTVVRLQNRFTALQADIATDARREMSQLSSWLASGGGFADYDRWKQRTAQVTPARLRSFAAAFAGAGRLATGTLEPPGGE